MDIRSVTIPHRGRSVSGVFYAPSAPSPAVLFCHGYNGGHRDFMPDAAFMAENGVASLAIDFCGGSSRDKSGFPTTSMTMATEKEDALAAAAWLAARPCVTDVFLFGGSMGGLASVLAGVEKPDRLAGLILLYPALSIADGWRARFPESRDVPETMDFWGMTLGRDYFLDLMARDLFSLLPQLDLPAVIFHGALDEVIPLSASERAAKLLNASLHIFPHEGHGFTPEAQVQVDSLALQFIRDFARIKA